MEKGENSYEIPENSPQEKRDPVGTRAGCHGCWARIWGDQVPCGCPWARRPPSTEEGAERLRSSSLGRQQQAGSCAAVI